MKTDDVTGEIVDDEKKTQGLGKCFLPSAYELVLTKTEIRFSRNLFRMCSMIYLSKKT